MKNPMRCKTKQRKGSRPMKILGYRRITANANSLGSRKTPGEINDHPGRHGDRTEFGLSPSKIGRALSETKAPFAFTTRSGWRALTLAAILGHRRLKLRLFVQQR